MHHQDRIRLMRMQIYLINLERRPDRLAAMTHQLERFGLSFERIDAIDAKAVDAEELDSAFVPDGPLGMLSPGDRACTLSHFLALRRIAEGDADHAVILEDDILLAEDAPRFLRDDGWIPQNAALVKLELFGSPDQLFLVDRRRDKALDRELVRLRSRHTGGGAYIISRNAATRFLADDGKLRLPIDYLLFHPGNSPAFEWLAPYQLLPALAMQSEKIGQGTDIHPTRRSSKPSGWPLIRRQVVRTYYDMRLLPKQIAAVLTGRARLVKIPFA
jgi:glycosyl transferase family 25